MTNKKISIILFCLYVVGIYTFTNVGVKPFVEGVATSDLFLEESDDPSEKFSLTENDQTRMALLQCNRYLKDNHDIEPTVRLERQNHQAWALGNYNYLIRSDVDFVNPSEGQMRNKFVCKIQYTGGEMIDHENWEITEFVYNDSNSATPEP